MTLPVAYPRTQVINTALDTAKIQKVSPGNHTNNSSSAMATAVVLPVSEPMKIKMDRASGNSTLEVGQGGSNPEVRGHDLSCKVKVRYPIEANGFGKITDSLKVAGESSEGHGQKVTGVNLKNVNSVIENDGICLAGISNKINSPPAEQGLDLTKGGIQTQMDEINNKDKCQEDNDGQDMKITRKGELISSPTHSTDGLVTHSRDDTEKNDLKEPAENCRCVHVGSTNTTKSSTDDGSNISQSNGKQGESVNTVNDRSRSEALSGQTIDDQESLIIKTSESNDKTNDNNNKINTSIESRSVCVMQETIQTPLKRCEEDQHHPKTLCACVCTNPLKGQPNVSPPPNKDNNFSTSSCVSEIVVKNYKSTPPQVADERNEENKREEGGCNGRHYNNNNNRGSVVSEESTAINSSIKVGGNSANQVSGANETPANDLHYVSQVGNSDTAIDDSLPEREPIRLQERASRPCSRCALVKKVEAGSGSDFQRDNGLIDEDLSRGGGKGSNSRGGHDNTMEMGGDMQDYTDGTNTKATTPTTSSSSPGNIKADGAEKCNDSCNEQAQGQITSTESEEVKALAAANADVSDQEATDDHNDDIGFLASRNKNRGGRNLGAKDLLSSTCSCDNRNNSRGEAGSQYLSTNQEADCLSITTGVSSASSSSCCGDVIGDGQKGGEDNHGSSGGKDDNGILEVLKQKKGCSRQSNNSEEHSDGVGTEGRNRGDNNYDDKSCGKNTDKNSADNETDVDTGGPSDIHKKVDSCGSNSDTASNISGELKTASTADSTEGSSSVTDDLNEDSKQTDSNTNSEDIHVKDGKTLVVNNQIDQSATEIKQLQQGTVGKQKLVTAGEKLTKTGSRDMPDLSNSGVAGLGLGNSLSALACAATAELTKLAWEEKESLGGSTGSGSGHPCSIMCGLDDGGFADRHGNGPNSPSETKGELEESGKCCQFCSKEFVTKVELHQHER